MATAARLSGHGEIVTPGLCVPVRYTLVVTLGGRRSSASGVIDAPEMILDAALGRPSPKLRLSDGTELAVALRRKVSDGPVLIRSIGSVHSLRRANITP